MTRRLRLLLSFSLLRPPGQRGRELFVQPKEMLKPPPLIRERLGAITPIHRPVEVAMRFRQVCRHRQRIIQIRQRRAGVVLPRIKHGLRRRLDLSPLSLRRLGPRKVVVDELGGVAVLELYARIIMHSAVITQNVQHAIVTDPQCHHLYHLANRCRPLLDHDLRHHVL